MSTHPIINQLNSAKHDARIRVQTLGMFRLWRDDILVDGKEWSRDTSLQLFQFMITARFRKALHKEQILDGLWGDINLKNAEQNFKVALHGINKVLEPGRESRAEPRFVIRQGQTYQIDLSEIWLDSIAIEQLIATANAVLRDDPTGAREVYNEARLLYKGIYLPNRLYDDWSSEERERLQVLILGAMTTLADLWVDENPMESVRLAEEALQIDEAWEDAYRIQMQAYMSKGNRPMAIKTYDKCARILKKEYGIDPLPETQSVLKSIRSV